MQVNVVQNKISTINPATGKVIASYNMTQNEQISQIINDARTAFEKWKKKDIPERCAHIGSLANLLKKNREQYAKIITEEMGKPITQSYAEIDKCVWLCEYYSEYAEYFYKIK